MSGRKPGRGGEVSSSGRNFFLEPLPTYNTYDPAIWESEYEWQEVSLTGRNAVPNAVDRLLARQASKLTPA